MAANGSASPLTDSFGRAHTCLRVSVTDRCNLRCTFTTDPQVSTAPTKYGTAPFTSGNCADWDQGLVQGHFQDSGGGHYRRWENQRIEQDEEGDGECVAL